MRYRIYELIKNNPLKYNSIEISKHFSVITDSEVRNDIKLICEDIDNFEYGIISEGHKYRLATKGEDIKRKVLFYRTRHQELLRQEKIWLKRQDKMSIKN